MLFIVIAIAAFAALVLLHSGDQGKAVMNYYSLSENISERCHNINLCC
jgi:hypothetical protein